EKIEKLMDAIGLERKLEKLGVKTQENMETIVSNGFNPERVKNNPRLFTVEALRGMLQDIR
ncbi:hypothetical protein KKI17_02860, partial [Patescibacteria group bacterium]|nr:hypothetical protein [Patescibacteria group bacterium]